MLVFKIIFINFLINLFTKSYIIYLSPLYFTLNFLKVRYMAIIKSYIKHFFIGLNYYNY